MNATVSTTRKDYVGGEISDAARIAFIFIGVFEVVIGVLGNVAIFVTVVKTRSMRSPHFLFMANLALADLILTGYTTPYQVLNLALRHYPVANYAHCVFNGFINNAAFCASTLSLVVISVNRYLHVCHSRVYAQVFSTRYSCSLSGCVLIWLVSGLWLVPGFINEGGFNFDEKYHYCSVIRAANNAFYLTLVTFSIGIPAVVICICNFAIWRFVRKSSHQIYAATRGMPNNYKNTLKVPKSDIDSESQTGTIQESLNTVLEAPVSMQQSDWIGGHQDHQVRAEGTRFASFDTTTSGSSNFQRTEGKMDVEDKTQKRSKVGTMKTIFKAVSNVHMISSPLITPDELALMKSLLSVSVCFVTLMTPYLVTIFVDDDGRYSSTFYISINYIVYMNFCVNCVLYGVLVPRFRKAMVKSMFCCVVSSNASI